jgi:prepilin peptidase CpaA
MGDAALGALAGFVGLVPFYALRLMGAGDVKFAIVLGLFCGPWMLLKVWLLGSLLAGLHAMAFYAINANPSLHILSLRYAQSGLQRRLDAYRQGRRGIPYAAYLAFGACLAVLYAVGS